MLRARMLRDGGKTLPCATARQPRERVWLAYKRVFDPSVQLLLIDERTRATLLRFSLSLARSRSLFAATTTKQRLLAQLGMSLSLSLAPREKAHCSLSFIIYRELYTRAGKYLAAARKCCCCCCCSPAPFFITYRSNG